MSVRDLFLLLWLLLPSALYADAFVVRDIRVQGLDRISPGTVFLDLPVEVGDRVDDTQSSLWIKALYATGNFADVRVARQRDVLIFTVDEHPGLAGISFEGNKSVRDEQLTEVLGQAGIAVGRVFNPRLLKLLTTGLVEQYQALGNFNVRINSEVQELPGNQRQLKIAVDEGEVSRIREFRISGNRRIKNSELLEKLESGITRWYEFWSGRDQYSRTRLTGDIETLYRLYHDQGYLDFEVTDVRVSLSPDKQSIYVEISVREGEQYRVGSIDLPCRSGLNPAAFEKRISLRTGKLFSRADVLEASQMIEAGLKDIGYANATVNAVPDKDLEKRTVDLAFVVKPGRKTYVRRINLTGNHGTNDEAFRRELRQLEASQYSADKIRLSKRRLQRLPYVQSAEINVLPVEAPVSTGAAREAATDQVDLDIHVVETRSGNFNLGAGYSDAEGAVFSFGLSQDNFLGSGNRARFVFNNSKVNTNYTASFFDPFHTLDGISRSWSLSYRSVDNSEQDISDTETQEMRAYLGFGIPLSEDDTLNLSLALQDIRLSPGNDIGTHLRRYYEEQCGWTQRGLNSPRVIEDCDFLNLIATVSFDYDTRDRALFPTEGLRVQGSWQTFIPIDGLAYYKLDYSHQLYLPLSDSDDYIFAGKAKVSYANHYGETVGVPPYDRFFAGGARNLRGYFNNSLGPRDSNGDPLGGEFRVLLSSDLYFPTDFLYDRRRLRMSAFADYGNVFTDVGEFSPGDMRGAFGLHTRWLTAVGSISFNFASHFKDRPGDETESFQFDLGGSF